MPIQADNEQQHNNASEQGYIFLLSHMRANTSLISHILGSHPRICGYYEMHQSYRSKQDLLKQQQLLQNNTDIAEKHSCSYLFDKILHNKYEFLLEELVANTAPQKIKVLLCIRSPEQSIKSIINLFRNKEEAHIYAQPEQAAHYYLQRVTQLKQFCLSHKKQYYYYDADLIRLAPEKNLRRLQEWLQLSEPLSEQYQIFSLTGKARAGDSSVNMQQGKIIKQQANYENISIPQDLLTQISATTKTLRAQIIHHAIDAITG